MEMPSDFKVEDIRINEAGMIRINCSWTNPNGTGVVRSIDPIYINKPPIPPVDFGIIDV